MNSYTYLVKKRYKVIHYIFNYKARVNEDGKATGPIYTRIFIKFTHQKVFANHLVIQGHIVPFRLIYSVWDL